MAAKTSNVRANDPRVRVRNDRPARRDGDYVAYWCQAQRRAVDNVALEYAIARANDLDLPLVVYESLRPDHAHANDRLHTFVLQCARDAAIALGRRGIAHGFFLPKTVDEARGVAHRVFARAALVVSDEHPSFVYPAQNEAAAARAPCAFVTIDDCAVVPLSLVPSHEPQARTIRPKLLRALDDWLAPLNEIQPRKTGVSVDWPFAPIDLVRADLSALVGGCAIDHDVEPITDRPGGACAASARLDAFLRGVGRRYDTSREGGEDEDSSGLSPYLHFGALSARACLLAARDAKMPPAARQAFVEQLLVRRGLAFNHAARRADHARWSSTPEWARATLHAHERDARPDARSARELESAKSGDAIWDACTRALVQRGRLPNVLRMFWGKSLLRLFSRPKDAFEFAVRVFDRYALDGRDPNTYAGVGWCFGLHDRPFPERAVFGTVRPMGEGALKRRFDLDDWLAARLTPSLLGATKRA